MRTITLYFPYKNNILHCFRAQKNTGTFPDVYIMIKYFRMTLICCEKRMLNENLKKKEESKFRKRNSLIWKID